MNSPYRMLLNSALHPAMYQGFVVVPVPDQLAVCYLEPVSSTPNLLLPMHQTVKDKLIWGWKTESPRIRSGRAENHVSCLEDRLVK